VTTPAPRSVKIVQPSGGRKIVVASPQVRQEVVPQKTKTKKVVQILVPKKQPKLVVSRQTEVVLTPRSARTPKQQPTQAAHHASIKSGIATASAIARDPKHPKREQAEELVRAYQRGWIDAEKFNGILQQLVF
jgi:hypothetical protein